MSTQGVRHLVATSLVLFAGGMVGCKDEAPPSAPADAAPATISASTQATAVHSATAPACSADLTSSHENCGQCGHVCAASELCTKSACTPRVPKLAGGNGFTCAIRGQGKVYCWGVVPWGGGIVAAKTQELSPVAIEGITDAVSLASGDDYVCALHAAGTVTCWGSGIWGNTSATQAGGSLNPTIAGLTNVARLDVGSHKVCAVMKDGTAACWGSEYGTASTHGPVPLEGVKDAVDVGVGDHFVCVLRRSGAVECTGAKAPKFTLTNGTRIIAQGDWAAVLKRDGSVSYAGQTTYNKDAVPETAEPLLASSTEIFSSSGDLCAVGKDGSIKCKPFWTSGDQVTNLVKQGAVEAAHGGGLCYVDREDKVWCEGTTGFIGTSGQKVIRAQPGPVSELSDAVAIASHGATTCAIRKTGTVACWGSVPAVGVKTKPTGIAGLDDATSLSVGSRICVTTKAKEVHCSGYVGDLTKDTTNLFSASGVPLKGINDAVQVAGDASVTCVLHASGKVDCRGGSVDGNAVQNNHAVLVEPVPGITDAKKVVATPYGGCALRAGGKLTCWHLPQTAVADRTITSQLVFDVDAKDIVDVAHDNMEIYVLDAKGSLSRFSWWFLSTNEKPTAPKPSAFGSAPGASELDFADGRLIVRGAKGDVAAFDRGQYLLSSDGAGTLRGSPTPVAGITDALHVAAGTQHLCALRSSGAVVCWGSEISGMLGDGTDIPATTSTPLQVKGLP